MPIDTSSYYPEVPSPDGSDNDRYSLNNNRRGLFGDKPDDRDSEQSSTPPPPLE